MLIINRDTNEIILEKLHNNIQVKKTRTDSTKPGAVTGLGTILSNGPIQQQQTQHQMQPQQQQMQPQLQQQQQQMQPQQQQMQQQMQQQQQMPQLQQQMPQQQQQQPLQQQQTNSSSLPPVTNKVENQTARHSSKTRVSTGVRKNVLNYVPKHSPLQGSPSYHPHRSPQQAPL